jgi:hypothetical protein
MSTWENAGRSATEARPVRLGFHLSHAAVEDKRLVASIAAITGDLIALIGETRRCAVRLPQILHRPICLGWICLV